MDNDNQIPLRFLDEADYCCDQIESSVLGLASKIPDLQALDQSLRAAHSIKGGAAMMGFTLLSQVAHQLEDFFKILRVRYHSKSVSIEVETLLLTGVDCLRQVGDLHRQGQLVDEAWLASHAQPIFDQLRQNLGDLRPEDEDTLLSQEGDVDPALLLLESAIQEAIELLNTQLNQSSPLSPTKLLQSLQITAAELGDFGRMAKLDRFISLCQSVKDQSQQISPDQATQLARQVLKAWRKSHSVVLLGRFEKIPNKLANISIAQSLRQNITPSSTKVTAEQQEILNRANVAEDLLAAEVSGLQELTEIGALDLSLWQSEITNLDLPSAAKSSLELLSELNNFEIPEAPVFFLVNTPEDELQQDINNFRVENLSALELWGELENFEIPESPTFLINNEDSFPLSPSSWDGLEFSESYLAGSEDPQFNVAVVTTNSASAPLVSSPSTLVITPAPAAIVPSRQSQTVRVPVEYLQQFNNIFGQLILERNAIHLRLGEIQSCTALLRKRMKHLELSNKELRQWYDQTSTEELISVAQDGHSSLANSTPLTTNDSAESSLAEFDLLEMDRYNDLHLVSQDQIETIVQLEEVTTDIELGLHEMTQSVRSLNQTTRMLQKNLTRTQMVPFADLVKRFPRLIRDLSVQFGKSVVLKIVGENTGIDRAIFDNLSDPLIHLLRNAFDHGIEDVATRLAKGKTTEGTIVLEASYRGGETIITITDDGDGIKLHRIRERLQQMGLPTAEVMKISEAELLETIFEPGFSTSASITELSGRGVGMDVVRTNIKEIRGDIRVKTQAGVGTTFTIRVPFALSILRVMLLERAGFVFAISLDSVREIINFQRDLLTADGQQIIWQSQVIPLIALEKGIFFGHNHRPLELSGQPTIDRPTILIIGEDQLLTAFYIDRFWGEKEVTLRPIDSLIPLTPGFGNSIILGDGRVVPLVDLVQLACWMSVSANFLTTLLPDKVASDSGSGVADPNQPNRILVIDDSINVRRYLVAMLEKKGYQVEQAKDGQEAVEKLVGGLVVQAAICDVEMPRLDGYGVLEALRSDEAFEDLPIVMLTSRSSQKHRSLAMNLGASAYFSKPYTESELLAKLSSLIEIARIK
jgi:two-component system, chemotaxis family, sensor histidine kinase and response regulator PixL